MNEHTNENWSTGQFVSLTVPSGPPIEVDCSSWESDIPPEKWSTGRFVPLVAPSSPPSEVDCSEWDSPLLAKAFLEISLRLAPDADPGKVMLFATRMIQEVHDVVPELDLKYDPQHSRAEAEIVVIGLASSNARKTEEKLEAVTQVIRAAAAESPLATLNSVRLARAA